jgi:hypothetical protein
MIIYKTKSNHSLFIDGISIPSSGLPIENESDRRFDRLENLVKLGFVVRVEDKNVASPVKIIAEVKKVESKPKSDETKLKIDDVNLKDGSNQGENPKPDLKSDDGSLKSDDESLKSDKADKTNSKSDKSDKTDKKSVADSSQSLYKIISQNNKKMIMDFEGNKLKDENGKNLKFDTVESAQAYIDALSL